MLRDTPEAESVVTIHCPVVSLQQEAKGINKNQGDKDFLVALSVDVTHSISTREFASVSH